MDAELKGMLAALYSKITDLETEIKQLKQEQKEPVKAESLDMRISQVLYGYEVKPNIKGYRYLREAIKLVYQNEDYLNAITSELYPTIADTYDDLPSRVERAIRHAVGAAWFKNRFLLSKPTNSEFIAFVAENLRLDSHDIA